MQAREVSGVEVGSILVGVADSVMEGIGDEIDSLRLGSADFVGSYVVDRGVKNRLFSLILLQVRGDRG